METVTYLKVSKKGKVTAFANQPATEPDEVVVKVNLRISDLAFEPKLQTTIMVNSTMAEPALLEPHYEIVEI